MDAEKCVVCGRVIPEGRQICRFCEEHPQRCETCKWHDGYRWICKNGESRFAWMRLHPIESCEKWEGKHND